MNKEQSKNQATFRFLQEIGHDVKAIRKALPILNNTTLNRMAKKIGVSKNTMYGIADGRSRNVQAIEGYGKELGIDSNEVFSDVLVIKI